MLLDNNRPPVNIRDIKGLICIDCWDDPDLEEYYQKLNTILDFEQFDSIIVASYEIQLDITDISLSNTLKEYSHCNYTPEVLLPIVKETRHRTTSNYVRRYFKEHSFLLLDTVSFVHHTTNCVPHINDWLVIGGGWGMCIHGRPMGFYNLSKINYNFYTGDHLIHRRKLGTLNRQMVEEDDLIWIDCSNGLYQLYCNNLKLPSD
jgi:hypothetical protein